MTIPQKDLKKITKHSDTPPQSSLGEQQEPHTYIYDSHEFIRESSHRQKVARTIRSIWTEDGGDISGISIPWMDGRLDLLGAYVTLEDYHDDDGTQSDNPHTGRPVKRAHKNHLPYHDFVMKYMRKNVPVVIDGLAEHWRASKDWVTKSKKPNVNYIERHFPNNTASVHVQSRGGFTKTRPRKEDITFREYADWWNTRQEETNAQLPSASADDDALNSELVYFKDWKFVIQNPSYELYTTPAYFTDDWLNSSMHQAYKFIYLGPGGTSTRLHADVLLSYSWSTNVCGKKRWYLIPPHCTFLLLDCFGRDLASDIHADLREGAEGGVLFPGLKFVRKYAIEIIQREGETVFVPSGWYHTVENLEDTLSINHNWINGTNLGWSWEKMRGEMESMHCAAPSNPEEVKQDYETPQLNGEQTSPYQDTSQVGDDLLLLWIMVSKKAKEILGIAKTDELRGPRMNDPGHDSDMVEYNLRAMLPVLMGIQEAVNRGKDQGLQKRCECDVDTLILKVRAQLEVED